VFDHKLIVLLVIERVGKLFCQLLSIAFLL
jgi:hypothetical protein